MPTSTPLNTAAPTPPTAVNALSLLSLAFLWAAIVIIAVATTVSALHWLPLGELAFIWPSSGVVIAALHIWGRRALPGVYLTYMSFELMRGDSFGVALAGAALTTLSLWIVHVFLKQAMRFEGTFQSVRDALAIFAGAGLMMLMKLATVVAALYAMGGRLSLETVASTWASPIAAGLGILIFTPLVLAWRAEWHVTFPFRRWLELGVLVAATITMSVLAFCGPMWTIGEIAHLPYLLFPLAFWAALRFGAREITTVVLISALGGMYYTSHMIGPYSASNPYHGQIALAIFIATLAGSSFLVLSAMRQVARATQAAESRGTRLAALIDRINEGVAMLDTDDRFSYVSARFCELTGFSSAELVGKRMLTDLAHPEDRALLPATLAGGMGTTEGDLQRGYARELRLLKHCGEAMAVQLSHRRLAEDVPGGGRSLVLINDITAEKLAQDALRDSEAKYRVLVDNQTELVVRLARGGAVVFASPSYLRFFGKLGTPVEGAMLDLKMHDDDRAGWDELLRNAWERREAVHTENRVITPTGQRWLAWSAQCLPDCCDDQGDTMILVARDVTDRHRAEEQARAHLQQLAHVSRVASMGEMAAAIAHEINQPLAAIANYCSASVRLLRSGATGTEDALNAMQRVAAEAERAGEIVRRMRSFVRSEEGELAAIAPRELVEHVVRLSGADARQSGVSVIVDVPADLPEVLVDAIQIEQVLLNLVRNAVEAIDSTPTRERFVRVRAQRVAGSDAVEFVVTDSGPGLRSDQLERVFDAFYTTKEDGMGIGLALSRSIAEAHGGNLSATSRRGEGASFHLRLPAVIGEEIEDV